MTTEHWRYFLTLAPTSKVVIDRFGLEFEPWKEWGSCINPDWWRDHQKVKHQRHHHFALADLEHCLNAAAGLFCLVLYLHHNELIGLQPKPRLFATAHTPGTIPGYFMLPDFS